MRIFIAGQEGMVGSAIYKLLKRKNYFIIDCKRQDLDITDQSKLRLWFKKKRPDVVINAAGKVGGILDNSLHQADYIYHNTIIGFNLIRCSLESNKVKKFINLGSACIYPKITKQPIKEEYLLSSYLEETNEGYAIAKIATLKYCEYIKNFYKKDFISLQPANLYGTGDNFDLKSSHVIPALIRKFHDAKLNNASEVIIWGTGTPKREFLYVDDMAEASVFVMGLKRAFYRQHINPMQSHINVGYGSDITIEELARTVMQVTGFSGKIIFDASKSDGSPKKLMSSKKLNMLGWQPRIDLVSGLKLAYEDFKVRTKN
jgi:GDP-L-fucose synthase